MPSLIGTPAEISEQLAEYQRLGIDEFVVVDRPFGKDLGARLEAMARFLEDVAAPYRD
jgi:alkanesulfonate monooxygenase SsuD/methylene tetrahydromethanopterin reductase-like flavin-dependent oxidoreductase (luciferase family)